MRWALLLSPFYRVETEAYRLSTFSVIHLISHGGRIKSRATSGPCTLNYNATPFFTYSVKCLFWQSSALGSWNAGVNNKNGSLSF